PVEQGRAKPAGVVAGWIDHAVGMRGMVVETERPALRDPVVARGQAAVGLEPRQPRARQGHQMNPPSPTDTRQPARLEPRPVDQTSASAAKGFDECAKLVARHVQNAEFLPGRIEPELAGASEVERSQLMLVKAKPGTRVTLDGQLAPAQILGWIRVRPRIGHAAPWAPSSRAERRTGSMSPRRTRPGGRPPPSAAPCKMQKRGSARRGASPR